MNLKESRKKILDWLCKSLIGPGSALDGETEDYTLVGRSPIDCYPTGVLFPVIKEEMGLDAVSEDTDDEFTDEATDKPQVEPAHKPRRYVPPSSVGFSFFIRGERPSLKVHPWAVKYVRRGAPDKKGGSICVKYGNLIAFLQRADFVGGFYMKPTDFQRWLTQADELTPADGPSMR